MTCAFGFFQTYRCCFEHPVVGLKARGGKYYGPWMYLIGQAAFKPHARAVKGGEVSLDRGQLIMSEAQLMHATALSRQEVRTFFRVLEEEGMIAVSKGITINQSTNQTANHSKNQVGTRGAFLVTICNYSKFQGGDLVGEHPENQAENHAANQSGSNIKNKDNNNNIYPSVFVSSSLHSEDTTTALPTGEACAAPSAGEGPGQIDLEELTTPGRGEPAPVAKVEAKPSKADERRQQAEQVFARYVEVTSKFKTPTPRKLTDNIVRRISARIKDYSFEEVMAAIDEIPLSEYLRGEAKWASAPMNIVTFFSPDSFTKTIDGTRRDEKYRRREGWTKDARKDWRNDIRDGETLRQACERNGEDVEFWESQYPPGQFDSIEYAR